MTGINAKPNPAATIPAHQWANIIKFLGAEDLKSLRLTGTRELGFYDPLFTNHLQLRADLVPFFGADKQYTSRSIRRWLHNRNRLVINGKSENIHPARVSYLVKNGYLDSVSQIIIFGCSHHRETISHLSMLPNLESLKLVEQHSYEAVPWQLIHDRKTYDALVQGHLDAVVDSLGKSMSLKVLDIEFDWVVSGRHLSVLEGMKELKSLRLRGFDFSEGIKHISNCPKIEHLHLCHGNFYSSPEQEVPETELLDLVGLTELKSVHLEGFDCMTDIGLKPFCQSKSMKELVLKHCQLLSGDSCSTIGAMTSLNSLHIVNTAYDEIEDFETEHLVQLLLLQNLKTLSLFHVLIDHYDILDLEGLDNLETLNCAFTCDLSEDDITLLCKTILPVLPSLKKFRVFTEDTMEMKMNRGNLEIEFVPFNLGDLAVLG